MEFNERLLTVVSQPPRRRHRVRRVVRRTLELLGYVLMGACMTVGAATIGAFVFVWYIW